MPKKKGGGGSGGGDKRESFFAAIKSEKLDTIRYSLSHGGIPITAEDDEGHRPLEIAATFGKGKALEQILQILDRQRALKDAIDMADEDGRTPLMMASAKGNLSCVISLTNHGASLTKKCNKGMTAPMYAEKMGKQAIVDFFTPESSSDEDEDGAPAEDDGLTTAERRKQRKQQLEEKNFGAVLKKTENVTLEEAHAAKLEEEDRAEAAKAVMQAGAQWEELKQLQHDRGGDVKELTLIKEDPKEAVPGADGGVDPALWGCAFLNRLSLKMPTGLLTTLSPAISQLNALDVLILTGNALTSLPESIGEISSLRVLEVDQNQLESLPSSMGNLSKLEVLNLAQNCIESTENLTGGNLPNLLTLLLDNNRLGALELPFGTMSRISTISAAHNQIETISEELGQAAGTLTSLSLADNKLVSLSGIRELKDKKLKHLNVEENPIADKKVFKLLNGSRPEQVIKELLKYLLKEGAGGKKKKK
eukprot:TRINITY_DN13881_c0_g1_i1.p1 TRINITY_DN13881_c0_g1~~TRINITY_DN13881_c0_g1_i1.p1  ORF type:complete len:477 (+),score=195.04 TRINITY_DN13881_c0_g1_i1:151-1581(+)